MSFIDLLFQEILKEKERFPEVARLDSRHFLMRNRHVGYSVLWIDPQKEVPLLLCKVAQSERLGSYLQEEWKILNHLKSLEIQSFDVPQPLFFKNIASHICTAYEWVQGVLPPKESVLIPLELSFFEDMTQCVQEVSGISQSSKTSQDFRQKWIHEWIESLQKELKLSKSTQSLLIQEKAFWTNERLEMLKPCLMHGDWMRSNVLKREADAKYILLDWETGLLKGFPLLDVFSFFHMRLVQDFKFLEREAFLKVFLEEGAYQRQIRQILQKQIEKYCLEGFVSSLLKLYLIKRVAETLEHVLRRGEGYAISPSLASLCELLLRIPEKI